MFKTDIADTLVVFRKDPTQSDVIKDEATGFLWLAGEVVDPEDGLTYIFYDVNGYDWKIPASLIGPNKEYDWLKTCYQRVLAGIIERRG